MKKIEYVFFIVLTISIAFFSGCSILNTTPTATSLYKSEANLKLSEKTPSSQTKGGITIDVKLPSESDKESPIFNRWLNIKYRATAYEKGMKLDSEGYTEVTKRIELPLYLELTPFKVIITNNTDHILRLKDSRIVFIDNNSENPYKGLTKDELTQDITQLPIYNIKLKELKALYPSAKPGNIESQLRTALLNILDDLTIINNFENEIIPELKSSGVIIFPVLPRKLSEGKVSFVDFISKTDAAGNPVEKVRFDYETSLETKYYKGDAPVGRGSNIKISWIEIAKDEYIKGKANPDKYYYDKTQEKWILGVPPKK